MFIAKVKNNQKTRALHPEIVTGTISDIPCLSHFV